MLGRVSGPGRGYAFISALLSLNALMCQFLAMGSRHDPLDRLTALQYLLLSYSGPAARVLALAAVGYATAAILKRSPWDGALAMGFALVALMVTSL